MYVPDHFEETDRSALLALIRDAPLGAFVINGNDGIEANHIPFVHRSSTNPDGVLWAHIPRANPLSTRVGDETRCLVVFCGPQGYVSPSWYATKNAHGRVVPTWNYAVVHAHGRARLVNDREWIREQLGILTGQMEAQRDDPWSVADAPDDFTRKLIDALVGLEVTVDRLVGKTKASQNQPEENQASVLRALGDEQPESAFSAWMQSVLTGRGV